MVFDPETLGRKHRQIRRTRVNVKHFLALIALKVMMMPVIAEFEPRIFTRQHDLTQCAVLDHGFEVSINRRDTKPRHSLPCHVEYLLRKQGPPCILHGFFNC